jgi:hypothetical protein
MSEGNDIFELISYIKEWKDRYWKEGRDMDAKIVTRLGNLLIKFQRDIKGRAPDGFI